MKLRKNDGLVTTKNNIQINTISEKSGKTSTKNRTSSSASDASEAEVSYAESEDSPWDEQVEEEPQELEAIGRYNLRQGNFVMVEFKGGKRLTTTNIFV